jgi:hypothetical protein
MYELVLNEDGAVKLQDGKPVYKDKDGKEIAVDVPQMYQKIIDLGKENKGHRENNEALTVKFKLFDGIEDLQEYKDKADKAIETVANFDEKDWLKADKVDSMKRQMKEAHEKEISQMTDSFTRKESDYQGKLGKKDEQIRKLMISAEFAKSPLFSGDQPRTTLSPDFAESFFGKQFRIEEQDTGELVTRAYYSNGDLIYSRANPGEPADFAEGMEEIWDKYPGKQKYIRTKQGSGSGGGDGDGGDPNDLTTMKKEYQKAVAEKNPALAIQLKNKIHALEMQRRG